MEVVHYIFIASILMLIPSPIKGNIKDFIIENESDLQRLGLADTDQHYDDDIGMDWMSDTCGGGGYGYGDYMANEDDMTYDLSQIDPRLLREIVQQMKYDPRFEHLWEHLNEETLLNGRMLSYGEEDDESPDLYVDLDENFQGDDNYEIE